MTNPTDTAPTILWGAKNISRAINLSERAVFHLLEAGQLPARKVGNRWAADRAELLAFFRTAQPTA